MEKMTLSQIQEKMNLILKEELESSIKITKLNSLIKDVRNIAGSNTIAYYLYVSTIHEAIGDLFLKENKIPDAEKAYKSMLATSKQLYELDKNNDYRFAFSCYKMASYYMNVLGCQKIKENPKDLTDLQEQVFKIADSLYKSSISSSMSNARKGYVEYAKLQASAMSEMALLYAFKKEYKMAAGFALDGVNVSKSVYKVLNNKEHLYLLINRINHLATIYKLLKKEEKTVECLKESIAYAQEKLAFDKVVLGMMIGKCYLNIGVCLDNMGEIRESDDMHESGVEAIAQANKDSEYTMDDEVIKAYIRVGEHYMKTKRHQIAKSYYGVAYEKALLANEKQEHPVYKNLITQLSDLLQLN